MQEKTSKGFLSFLKDLCQTCLFTWCEETHNMYMQYAG